MRKNHYIVTFTNGINVYAGAFNPDDAVILSKAIMILKGLSNEVALIRKVNANDSAIDAADYVAGEVSSLSDFSYEELLDEIKRRVQQ